MDTPQAYSHIRQGVRRRALLKASAVSNFD